MNTLRNGLRLNALVWSIGVACVFLFVLFISHDAQAQMQLRDPGFDGNAGQPTSPTPGPRPTSPGPDPRPTVPPGDIVIDFPNPLEADSLQCLIYDVFSILINVFAIVAALFIIWSGFKFVAAQGNPEKLKEARRTFIYVLIGTAIILGAWVITQFIVNTVNELMDQDILRLSENACEADDRR